MASSTISRKMIHFCAVTLLCAGAGAAQTAALSVSSGSAAPGGTVNLNIALTSSEAPAGLEWTVNYPTQEISSVSMTSASEMSCSNAPGSSTCVVWSINSNTLPNGAIATLAFNISAGASGSSAIQLSNSSAVSSLGSAITTSTTGGTITFSSVPVISSATTASGVVGSAFSYQITASNSPTSFTATGLPTGLSVNGATGLISGTPTAAGTSTVTLSATNSAGTGNATVALSITSALPVISSATTASGVMGTTFSYQITASNSPTSFAATGLPAGLSVNGATGLISGTPTASGTSTVTLAATNSAGTGSASITLTIAPVPASISFVQVHAKAASSSVKSSSLAFSKATAAGDLILVAFDFDSNVTAFSVTDSQGNTFVQVGTGLTSPGGYSSQLYYAKNIIGGADTVTVKLSGSSSVLELYLTEYAGADPTNPIDTQAGESGQAGAVSSGNGTTSVAGDLIFGYCLGDATCSSGSGFTPRSTLDSNLIEDMIAGGPGSYAATATANSGWTMQMVALKPR